jgi:hypothetical protein
VRFSPDGKKLATGGHDARVRVWEAATGRRLGQVRFLPGGRPISFLADGKSLLIQEQSAECFLLDVTSFRSLHRFGRADRSYPGAATVCRPHYRQAAVLTNNRIDWYEVPGGKSARSLVLSGTPAAVRALSPDGTVLATATDRGDITLWDTSGGKPFATLTGHAASVTALAFSPDSRRLASASHDTTVLVWDVERPWAERLLGEVLVGRSDVRTLAAFPERGVEALKRQLLRAARAEGQAERLVKDLDDDSFAVREKAHRRLEKLGADAVHILRRTLTADASAEVRARIRRLLARIDPKETQKALNPARARLAVTLLVKLGTPAARRALEELAREEPDSPAGKQARLALEQMPGGKSKP